MPAPEMSQALLGAAQDAAQMAYGGYVMPKYQGSTGTSTVDPKHGSRQVDANGDEDQKSYLCFHCIQSNLLL